MFEAWWARRICGWQGAFSLDTELQGKGQVERMKEGNDPVIAKKEGINSISSSRREEEKSRVLALYG